MIINNSYITEPPQLTTPGSVATLVDPAEKHQRTQQARDSYRKNAAAAPIIEAEYVDYRPETKTLRQERHDLHLSLEPETVAINKNITTAKKTNPYVAKYQMTPVDLPLPGTYINTFA